MNTEISNKNQEENFASAEHYKKCIYKMASNIQDIGHLKRIYSLVQYLYLKKV